MQKDVSHSSLKDRPSHDLSKCITRDKVSYMRDQFRIFEEKRVEKVNKYRALQSRKIFKEIEDQKIIKEYGFSSAMLP